jgi:hypothetical protein
MILFVLFFTLTALFDKPGKHIDFWKFVQIFDLDAASSEYLINGEEGEMIDIPPKFRWINAASSQFCYKNLRFSSSFEAKMFKRYNIYKMCDIFQGLE